MSDLFHPDVPDDVILEIIDVAARCPDSVFQILTKRADRLEEWASKYFGQKETGVRSSCENWPPKNVWFGVSVENQRTLEERLPLLLGTPTAGGQFLSVEPLLGPLDFEEALKRFKPEYLVPSLCDILGWIVVSGEGGPGARECDVAWIQGVVDFCEAWRLPCFVKQLGAKPTLGGMKIDAGGGKNKDLNRFPAGVVVRSFPQDWIRRGITPEVVG